MDDRSTPLILITGQTQNGKSTLKRGLVMQRNRVIECAPFPVASAEYPVEQFYSVEDAIDAFEKSPNIASFRVAIVVKSVEEFKRACWLAWMKAPATLVADETRLYLPSVAEAPLEFEYMTQAWAHAGDHLGERREVQIILIGQRLTNAPPIYRDETNVWYAFRMNGKSDRQKLIDDFGVPPEIAEQAGKLERFHYMRFDRFGGVSYGKTQR